MTKRIITKDSLELINKILIKIKIFFIKILESWKQKELVNESNLSKAKFEKETFLNNETRFKMVNLI